MEKLFTERAHLMCPRMNFGIAMCVDHAFDAEGIKEAFKDLAEHHPFLRSVIWCDEKDNSYYYDLTAGSKIELAVNEEPLTGLDDPALLKTYQRLIGYEWDVRKSGMLKVIARRAEDKTIFLMVFHHLLADGRGALDLAEELADFYAENKRRPSAEEKLISSVEDMPKNSGLPFFSKKLVDKANKDWAMEHQTPLTYQRYIEFADKYVKQDVVKFSMTRASAEDLAKLDNESKSLNVSVNDLLMARMYHNDKTDKIIIAKDLRDSLPFYNKGALGNYSTAFSITIKDPSKEVGVIAKEVHKKVKKTVATPKDLYLILQCYAALTPEVLDAAFMAAKGQFVSKSAEFIGKQFFGFEEAKGCCLTNLGKIENKNIVSAAFIPPASPAMRKTLGVLTVNGEMITCVSER